MRSARATLRIKSCGIVRDAKKIKRVALDANAIGRGKSYSQKFVDCKTKIEDTLNVMNDYSQLNNEQIESRLAHISVEETITPEFEVPIFNSSKLWDLLGEIHREVDEQISACAKINDQIDEKILRRY